MAQARLQMETAGEERVRASNSLKQLEDAALLLENASKQGSKEKVSPGFPQRVSGILNALTAISSREDAERLLSTGLLASRIFVTLLFPFMSALLRCI